MSVSRFAIVDKESLLTSESGLNESESAGRVLPEINESSICANEMLISRKIENRILRIIENFITNLNFLLVKIKNKQVYSKEF